MSSKNPEKQIKPIIWNNSYSVGNPHIDRQHKILLSLTNDLLEGIKENKGTEIISDILSGAMDYTQTHFTYEEIILKHSKYPGYETQRVLHEEFQSEINSIIEKYKKGAFDGLLLLDFLRKWWSHHICKEDKQYESYIKDVVKFEIDEAESVYSDVLNIGLKDITLSNEQMHHLRETAGLFNGNENQIINNWLGKQPDNYRKFPVLREGLEMLLSDFIECFSQGDQIKYLDRNEIMGKHIAAQDIPYHIFMNSFHHWEDSYKAILQQNFGEDFQNVLSTMDYLHHTTISILAKQYFNVRDATIFALAKLAESRDPETGNHLLRTREYSAILAKELGCSNEFVDYMYNMSPLHDIGKVGIPDNILLKPGKLTEEEFNQMKEHT